MLRSIFFWIHFSLGISAGLFVFVMAATGVVLSFERQIVDFVDRDIRSVTVPNDTQPRSLVDLLGFVRQSGVGHPTAIVLSHRPEAAVQFTIGRGKNVYVDPYSGAILGGSSASAQRFFFVVERLHRTLGASLGSKGLGHWLTAFANLFFGVLILLGVILWLPRRWKGNAMRVALTFRSGLRGKARDWNWHNVIGIWCALPLLVIVLTGTVMSFEWANTLLFRLSGSLPPSHHRGEGSPGDFRPNDRRGGPAPNYDRLFAAVEKLAPDWRTITLAVGSGSNAVLQATADAGTGGQPQKRTQYLLEAQTGAVVRKTDFADGSLGQRLRAFVRFGHTGEYGGWPGQAVAAVASIGACVLTYTGLALAARRVVSARKRALLSRDSWSKQVAV